MSEQDPSKGVPGPPAKTSDVDSPPEPEVVKLPPDEEAALLKESNDIKSEANALFSSKEYSNAVASYNDALDKCPSYLHYPRAVIQSNIAACHLMDEEWKPAIKAATSAVESLDKLGRALQGSQEESVTDKSTSKDQKADAKDDEVEEEIVSSGASRAAPAPQVQQPPSSSAQPTDPLRPSPSDILRIRAKSLLRRARANSRLDTWSSLSSAVEDYKVLAELSSAHPSLLGGADAKVVRQQLRVLPDRAKQAQEKEVGEMWGKLRNLGDGILKPFGLSTDNFKMVKDEKSGGYSMSFDQNAGGASGD